MAFEIQRREMKANKTGDIKRTGRRNPFLITILPILQSTRFRKQVKMCSVASPEHAYQVLPFTAQTCLPSSPPPGTLSELRFYILKIQL